MKKEIKGREVLNVRTISTGNPYNADAVAKGHKFFGTTYALYQYDGVAFTINSKDPINEWITNGILYSMSFEEGTRVKTDENGVDTQVKNLTLISATNTDQEIKMAQTEATLLAIFKSAPVEAIDETLLSAIS
jgi:hypothetical protein